MRSLPLCPKTWSSASPPVRVSFSLPPNSRSKPPRPSRVSLPACPNSWSPPAPPLSVSLPVPPNRLAAGSAPLAWLRLITSWPSKPRTRICAVLATVGVPPRTVTAPPLTRIVPAASRVMVIVLSSESPLTVSTPVLNVEVTAALAVPAVPAIRPAATTLLASSRRVARLQPLLCPAFIRLVPFRAPAVRTAGCWTPRLVAGTHARRGFCPATFLVAGGHGQRAGRRVRVDSPTAAGTAWPPPRATSTRGAAATPPAGRGRPSSAGAGGTSAPCRWWCGGACRRSRRRWGTCSAPVRRGRGR